MSGFSVIEPGDVEPEPVALVTIDVVCHVEGCGNADETIRLSVPDEPTFVQCGVCGGPITDVALVAD